MKLDNNKLQLQQHINQLWRDNGGCGTLVAVTGFGKSYCGVLLIQDMNARHPSRTTCVIVPSIFLKSQWEEHIRTFGLKNVRIIVINSAVKERICCDFLILDEIHRYASDVFSTIFQHVSYQFILGLTATFERKDMRHHLLEFHAPVLYTLSMKEALARKFVSEFQSYNLAVPLSYEQRELYRKMSARLGRYFGYFGQDLDTVMKATKNKELQKQLARQWGVPEQQIVISAVNFLRLMQKRKSLLYNNEEKQLVAKSLVEAIPVKAITFSESQAFADTLTADMGAYAASYHSKLGQAKKREIINGFTTGEYRVLNTARALDEGMDITDIEMAVICSGTSTQRQQIQRIGRTIRFVPDKQAIVVNLYIPGTRDENWLRERQKGIPNTHWIQSIGDIDYVGITESDFPSNDLNRVQLFAAAGEV